MRTCQLHRLATAAFTGTGDNQSRYPGLPGALKDRVEVIRKAVMGQISADVDQCLHSVAFNWVNLEHSRERAIMCCPDIPGSGRQA